MTYITLDCRDGQHEACDLCSCECHEQIVDDTEGMYYGFIIVGIGLAVSVAVIGGLIIGGLIWLVNH
jgi:hypothetical protein